MTDQIAGVATVIGASCDRVIANAVLGAYGPPGAFPDAVWTVPVAFVARPAAGGGPGFTVLVSAPVTTFQEANQISGVVVVPVVGMVLAQIAGLLLFDTALPAALGTVLWLLTFLLMRFAVGRLRRDRLVTRY